MKAESDSGLLFFPSGLEMGKENVFLVDQKAQPLGYKDSTVMTGDGLVWGGRRRGGGEGQRKETTDTVGLGWLGYQGHEDL